MFTENHGFRISRILIVFVGIFLCAMLSVIGAASAVAGVKILNPVHGHAKIKGEATSYYYYRARIAADTETSVIFKQDTCSVSDANGKKYSKCWVHIAGASAGLSLVKQAPLSMKTLGVELEGGKSSGVVQWNTAMVDGPKGCLLYTSPS